MTIDLTCHVYLQSSLQESTYMGKFVDYVYDDDNQYVMKGMNVMVAQLRNDTVWYIIPELPDNDNDFDIMEFDTLEEAVMFMKLSNTR